jgi:hypothetical protein
MLLNQPDEEKYQNRENICNYRLSYLLVGMQLPEKYKETFDVSREGLSFGFTSQVTSVWVVILTDLKNMADCHE